MPTREDFEREIRYLEFVANKDREDLRDAIYHQGRLYARRENPTIHNDPLLRAQLEEQIRLHNERVRLLDNIHVRSKLNLRDRLEEYKQMFPETQEAEEEEDLPPVEGLGRMRGGKKWNFSNRNYNPATLAYNALLNGMTENYRSDITKEGVRQDVDRNIEQAKKFAKNPNPVAFVKNEAEGQFSRYGSGFPANPSDYQPRRFL
jgi:hypothetical protein